MATPGEADKARRAEAIRTHVETHLGVVVGEVRAGPGHGIDLDILHVDVTESKPFHVLVTSGMSDRPMAVPEDGEASPRAELLMALDASWPFGPEHVGDDRHAWPLKLLASLARLPHAHDLWFGVGHSVPNGNPPEPYVEGVGYCGVVMAPSLVTPPEFARLDLDDGPIDFLAAVPVYAEEMKLKLDRGVDALFQRFDEHQINEIMVPDRRKVAGGLFELL